MKLGGAFKGWIRPPLTSIVGSPRSPLLPPRLALLEMGLLIALVLAEYAVEGFLQVTRINPHPYWIAVLLLSLQYGTVSGLMAAGIAIGGTLLIGLPEPDIEERYFNYLVRVWTQPVLWLLVALLLGTFRARQIEQRDELLFEVENLKTRGATLLDHVANLRARNIRLERYIATRPSADASQLLASLGRLEDAEPGRWVPALKATLTAGFPGARLSLYAVDGDKARLLLTHDDSQTETISGSQSASNAEIETGSPLLAAVVGAGHAVSVLNPADDASLDSLGVAAVPIFVEQQGAAPRVAGILLAERIPPSLIDASMLRRLRVIAVHLTPVLAQARLIAVATNSMATFSSSALTSDTGIASREVDIPKVRRWRMLRWLPGNGSAPPSTRGGNDG